MKSFSLSPLRSQGRNLLLAALALACAALPGRLFAEETVPPELKAIKLDDHLGRSIPLDARFVDETGRSVAIGDYLNKDIARPLLLVPVYYNCPMLCTFTLNSLADTLKGLKLAPGKDFDLVAFSFDPAETPQLAETKKDLFVKSLGTPEAAAGLHFLVGEKPAISALADALGFRFEYDPVDKSFKHAPAVYAITPDGKISRFFPSINFEPKDVRLALVDASGGKIGTVIDKFVLYCSHYNPQTGKYSLIATRVMQAGGIATIVALGWLLGFHFLLERRRSRLSAAARQDKADASNPDKASIEQGRVHA